uniref:VCRL1 variant J-1 n=1 Tax=Ciona intestinalis TaxID=7719 RepID=I3NN98_CIOIN|nr:vCRL1 variant J-1 [Ciona intestinalis]
MLLSFLLMFLHNSGCLCAIQLPQPGNQANVATGTTNLMITAAVTVTTSTTTCSWSGTGLSNTEFYSSGFGGCQTVTPTATHSITCTHVPGGFNASLTYLTAMTSNTNVSLICDSPTLLYSLSMIVKVCQPNTASGVIATVSSSPCGFGCTVQYSCESGYNGNDTTATCQADATFDASTACTLISRSKPLSDGAIAGIVIGCLIAVAIIIFFLIPICCAEICCCAFTILCLSWGKKKYTAGRS